MRARDLLDHLLDLAPRQQSPVREFCAVRAVERNAAGFELQFTDSDALRARIVVGATGYFRKPNQPDLPTDGSVPCLHTADISDHARIYDWGRQGKRILVVGRRISAGQLLTLAWSAGCQVHLSTQGPIQFSPEGWWRRGYEILNSLYEPLRLLLQPARRGNSYPGMPGGKTRRLIESGQVPVHPRPVAIRGDRVEFADDTSAQFDLVVFATGYRPCLDCLRPLFGDPEELTLDHIRSLRHPRFSRQYFLGFDNALSFRSRYLRGIRADARWLARKI
jgi:putative flavoprotein involved in K+ transport